MHRNASLFTFEGAGGMCFVLNEPLISQIFKNKSGKHHSEFVFVQIL